MDGTKWRKALISIPPLLSSLSYPVISFLLLPFYFLHPDNFLSFSIFLTFYWCTNLYWSKFGNEAQSATEGFLTTSAQSPFPTTGRVLRNRLNNNNSLNNNPATCQSPSHLPHTHTHIYIYNYIYIYVCVHSSTLAETLSEFENGGGSFSLSLCLLEIDSLAFEAGFRVCGWRHGW